MNLKILPSYLIAVVCIGKSILGPEAHIDNYKDLHYDLNKNDLCYVVKYFMPDIEKNFLSSWCQTRSQYFSRPFIDLQVNQINLNST